MWKISLVHFVVVYFPFETFTSFRRSLPPQLVQSICTQQGPTVNHDGVLKNLVVLVKDKYWPNHLGRMLQNNSTKYFMLTFWWAAPNVASSYNWMGMFASIFMLWCTYGFWTSKHLTEAQAPPITPWLTVFINWASPSIRANRYDSRFATCSFSDVCTNLFLAI